MGASIRLDLVVDLNTIDDTGLWAFLGQATQGEDFLTLRPVAHLTPTREPGSMGKTTWGLAIITVLALSGCDDVSTTASGRARGVDVSTTASDRAGGVDVRCTDAGFAIERDSVTASADGVHLSVENLTDHDAFLITDVLKDPSRTVPPGKSSVVLLAPPGEVHLTCGASFKDASRSRSAVMTVEDPKGFYHSVDLADALGCQPNVTRDGDDPGWGSTAREAAEDFAGIKYGKNMIREGNGYRDQIRKEFLFYVDGRGFGTLDVYPDGDQYRAAYGVVCSPGFGPFADGGDG